MKTQEAEQLHPALTDDNIQLKHLSVDPYMKTIRLIKAISAFLDERAADIRLLIKEYNKDFSDAVKSEKFKTAAKKKAEDLTSEESELLTLIPIVQVLPNNMLSGPQDFIDKVDAINARELKFKKGELNFINDAKVFKSVVENVPAQHQTILYDFLFALK